MGWKWLRSIIGTRGFIWDYRMDLTWTWRLGKTDQACLVAIDMPWSGEIRCCFVSGQVFT